jgi:ketosteroid isomerase-like protein
MSEAGARHPDPRVERVIGFFEALGPEDVQRLRELYVDDAFFKDPFNEVHSRAAIEGIFRHMFVALDGPRFVIVDALAQGDQCFLSWEFHFRMKRFDRAPQVIRGGTHIRFAPDGRIAMHRDYWDAAEELYQKLPVVGALMRWLKRRANS